MANIGDQIFQDPWTIVAVGHLWDRLVNFWPFNNFIETDLKISEIDFYYCNFYSVVLWLFCVLNWVVIHSVIVLIAVNIFCYWRQRVFDAFE